MSDLVGNPKDGFSHVTAHISFFLFGLVCAEEDLIKNAAIRPRFNASMTKNGAVFNITDMMWTTFGILLDNAVTTQFTFSIPYAYVDFINEIYFEHSFISGNTDFNYQVNYTIVHDPGSTNSADAVRNILHIL